MGTVRRAIKADARAALKGRTGTAAAITFILMLTAFALSLAEAVIPLLLNIPGFLQQAVGAADIWESIRATAPWYLLATGIAALEEGEKNHTGVVVVDGSMVDKPMELRALTTLAQAKAAGINVEGMVL